MKSISSYVSETNMKFSLSNGKFVRLDEFNKGKNKNNGSE